MRICHLTINAIDLERRILNQASSAVEHNFKVFIIAHDTRCKENLESRTGFEVLKLSTAPFDQGPLKFLIFNIKAGYALWKTTCSIIHCHDLWVLPAAAIIAYIKRLKLVYDAHEYYRGLEIFAKRPLRRAIWAFTEQLFISRCNILLTVSEPLGELYRQKYPGLKKVEIIRNLPVYKKMKRSPVHHKSPHLVFQGHFKPGRGLEILFHALRKTGDVHLTLIGGGELLNKLQQLKYSLNLENRVHFSSYVPPDNLISLTSQFDAGVVLFQPTSVNYAHALPNKFFEYIMAGLPVLASDIDTLKHYVQAYELGILVNAMDADAVAKGIMDLFADDSRRMRWRKNALRAAQELNWEKEAVNMVKIYEDLIH